jgi:hypothetical protein
MPLLNPPLLSFHLTFFSLTPQLTNTVVGVSLKPLNLACWRAHLTAIAREGGPLKLQMSSLKLTFWRVHLTVNAFKKLSNAADILT